MLPPFLLMYYFITAFRCCRTICALQRRAVFYLGAPLEFHLLAQHLTTLAVVSLLHAWLA